MLLAYKTQIHSLPFKDVLTASDIAGSLSLGFDMKSKQVIKHHYRIKLMLSDTSLAPVVRSNHGLFT